MSQELHCLSFSRSLRVRRCSESTRRGRNDWEEGNEKERREWPRRKEYSRRRANGRRWMRVDDGGRKNGRDR